VRGEEARTQSGSATRLKSASSALTSVHLGCDFWLRLLHDSTLRGSTDPRKRRKSRPY
jgi:hypothetical protein